MNNKLNNKTGNLGVCREDREMKYNSNQIKEGDLLGNLGFIRR